jgi:hypothetical protein
MAKRHGGTHHVQGVLNHRGTKPQPSPIHHASGKPLGVLHSPPSPGGAVNDQNYARQQVKKK